ncbi:MAG: glycosyltransferase [Gemmatimonadota bacterium]|nr:glycosyltransferase [Gemmatimonadota bacterium]
MTVSVILPTYNERENIGELIDCIDAALAAEPFAYECLVVDDNSPDGTAQFVREQFANRENIRVYVRTHERGLASAIKHGVLNAAGDVLVVMDTDFNHDPRMIPQMVKFLEFYDIVIGSRFVMRGGMREHGRYLLSFVYNLGLRTLLRTQIQDNLSGFFSMNRDKLLALDLDRIFVGYGDYFIRLLLFVWRKNYQLLEVPVFYQLRRHGESKTGFLRIFKDYTITVLRLRWQISRGKI